MSVERPCRFNASYKSGYIISEKSEHTQIYIYENDEYACLCVAKSFFFFLKSGDILFCRNKRQLSVFLNTIKLYTFYVKAAQCINENVIRM